MRQLVPQVRFCDSAGGAGERTASGQERRLLRLQRIRLQIDDKPAALSRFRLRQQPVPELIRCSPAQIQSDPGRLLVQTPVIPGIALLKDPRKVFQIGRASCRERV